jgi:predicted TIM-barrel fold metal-dependent hydrolase
MIIDCHCHAGAGDGLTGPWDTRAPLTAYLRRASAAGITHTNLFAAFHTDYARANHEVSRIVASRPGQFYGFAFVNAVRDRGRVRQLVQTAVQRYGFVGIKVHRHEGRITREICDVARDFGLPVLYDVMGEVSVCELLAREYPTVPFIIPHLASFAGDWRAHLALIDQLVRHRNIHTDTSGVQRFDLLAEAVQRAGARKILFGTDGPWLHPAVELAKVRALQLSVGDERKILARNFLRLIDGVVTQPRKASRPISAVAATIAWQPEANDPWLRPAVAQEISGTCCG